MKLSSDLLSWSQLSCHVLPALSCKGCSKVDRAATTRLWTSRNWEVATQNPGCTLLDQCLHEEIEKEEKEMEGANRELSCSSKVIKNLHLETCSLTWPLFSSSISGTCPGKDASNRKLAGEKLSPPRTLSYLPGTCKSLGMFLEGFILRLS